MSSPIIIREVSFSDGWDQMEALTANTKQSQANPIDEGWGMDYRSDKSRRHHHHENTAHRVNITGLIGDQRK